MGALGGPDGRRQVDDDRDLTILVSGLGLGGGLFELTGGGARRIDDGTTTGLGFDPTTGRLARSVRLFGDRPSAEAVVVYGADGLESLFLPDRALDVHDVLLVGDEILLVSSHYNALFLYGTDGTLLEHHRIPAEFDSWHLNCLTAVDGELVASVFGTAPGHRAFAESTYHDQGLVFSLHTGRVVARGLAGPHTPRSVDGRWLVCDSMRFELVSVAPGSAPTDEARVQLRAFTRGLAVHGDRIWVGESGARAADQRETPRASVAVLDRRSWELVDRIPVDAPELYDVVVVPRRLVDAVDRSTPEVRAGLEAGQRRWVGPLPAGTSGAPGVAFEGAVPATLAGGALVEVDCVVSNPSDRIVASRGARASRVTYRWGPEGGGPAVGPDGDPPLRTSLPTDLDPGHRARLAAVVRVPPEPGSYRLELALEGPEERGGRTGWSTGAPVRVTAATGPCDLSMPPADTVPLPDGFRHLADRVAGALARR